MKIEVNTKNEYKHLYTEGKDSKSALERLESIISILRKECPWDREQTHESLRSGMLEEAYEVVEAINNKDKENLKEELGDVMLQVIFHSNLGEEEGDFNLTEVINMECQKMIRRHPHVFLEENANKNIKSIDKVLEKWENIKVQEKGRTSTTCRMKEVPKALPALTKAYKVQKRAAESGFDWADVSGAFDKIKEEREELIEAYNTNPLNQKEIEAELGDLLFSCVNAARFLKADPETALEYTIEKFIRRFAYVEEKALSCGKALEDMSLDEMDALWELSKKEEASNK